MSRHARAIPLRARSQVLRDVAAEGLKQGNPFSLRNLPYTIAGVVIPIAAMKVLTVDVNELGVAIRIEWQIDEDLVEMTETSQVSEQSSTTSMRDLNVGDVIEMPGKGQQRVIEVGPDKIVTEPVSAASSQRRPHRKPNSHQVYRSQSRRNQPPRSLPTNLLP
jgi:hypothetical protein